MSYVALADIEGLIPPGFLTQALDDDADGEQDAWDRVAADATAAVDATLGLRFEVPFTEGSVPGIASEAAKVFACEQCYARRGVTGDANPWTVRADEMRRQLRDIAAGKLPLGPDRNRSKPSGVIIKESAPTYDRGGRRLV